MPLLAFSYLLIAHLAFGQILDSGTSNLCTVEHCVVFSIYCLGGKGEVEAHGMDHWTLVGEKLTAEKNLAEEAKKVRARSVRRKVYGTRFLA